jgi:ABC-type nitrate/sulfonate/bicarbonate transport system substrate-binding protein
VKNIRARVAGGAFVAVLVAAVSMWFTQVASAQPVVRYANFKAYDPVFVGIEKGFFKMAGVTVKLVGNYPSGPASVQGAATGQVDAGLCAVTGLIAARAAGIQVRGIADSQTEFNSAPLQRFYVRSDSDIRTIRDLKGKRVAVNSTAGSFYYALLVALSRNGMSASDIRPVIMPLGQMQQALMDGQVDVVGLIDPFNRKLELDGGARLLFRAVDAMGARHVSLIFFTLDYMERNHRAVQAFVKGYIRAINWSRDNPRAAAGIMWKYIDVPPRYAIRHRYTVGAKVRMDQVQWWISFMRREGALRDGGRLTAASVATTRYTGR